MRLMVNRIVPYFNSTMVRLEVDNPVVGAYYTLIFQFHFGTIGGVYCINNQDFKEQSVLKPAWDCMIVMLCLIDVRN